MDKREGRTRNKFFQTSVAALSCPTLIFSVIYIHFYRQPFLQCMTSTVSPTLSAVYVILCCCRSSQNMTKIAPFTMQTIQNVSSFRSSLKYTTVTALLLMSSIRAVFAYPGSSIFMTVTVLRTMLTIRVVLSNLRFT